MNSQLQVFVPPVSVPAVDPTPRCVAKRNTLHALIVLARPWQWIKNGLVLAALVFSHRLFYPRDALLAAVAFAAFCALSSFAYVLNDISDREADRLSAEKRNRPLARGELTIRQAASFAVALGAVAALLSIAAGLNFLAIAALYVALQFGYSLWAKQRVILDVIAVGIGFVLRAFAGAIAIGADVSPWLVFITFMLAMLLVLGRRRHELVAMGDGASEHRAVLAQYSLRLLDQMLAIVAGATLISYMIYTASAEVEAKLGTRYLYLTVPFVAFGILRYLYLVDARNEGGDPARLLIRDKPLLLTVLLWIAADVFLLYFQAAGIN
jgi:4-hydroxybenzoate polyprenyltransferase